MTSASEEIVARPTGALVQAARPKRIIPHMEAVFVLWHVHKLDGGRDDAKLIGVCRTEDRANAAIERLRARPGFVDAPDGFVIDQYQLYQDHWNEEYVTGLARFASLIASRRPAWP